MAFMSRSDAAWESFGKTEPYFAVASIPEFQNEKLTDEARSAFFRSGEEHVQWVLDLVHQHVDSRFQPKTALDFGCGVGRLVIPFAERCERVMGIDISSSMLDEARRNCEERSLTNVLFFNRLDQIEPQDIKFDLVHTFIVLQHIPVRRGMAIFNDCIDLLADGGVGIVHVPYWREASALHKVCTFARQKVPLVNNILNLIQGNSFFRPTMEMNSYPLVEMFRLLQLKNCMNIVIRFIDHSGYFGAVLLFKKNARDDIR